MADILLKRIHDRLAQSGKTVSAAESCTGGLLSAALTSLPGSSAYFILGTVVYSNRSKSLLLKIPAELIKKQGAVSETVCKKMASGIRGLAKSDFGIGITGIAGPSGAVPGKPVGTVFVAVCAGRETLCRRFLFKGGRGAVRSSTVKAALEMLYAAARRA